MNSSTFVRCTALLCGLLGGLTMIDDAACQMGLPAQVTLAQQPLRDWSEPAVRAAVETFNAAHRAEMLPDELNPTCLSPAEVLAFMTLLRTSGSTLIPAGLQGPIELGTPSLKLRVLDGFGLHGLARPFQLLPGPDGWRIEPAYDRVDIEAELAAAWQLLSRQEQKVIEAERAVAGTAKSDPTYPPLWSGPSGAVRRSQHAGRGQASDRRGAANLVQGSWSRHHERASHRQVATHRQSPRRCRAGSQKRVITLMSSLNRTGRADLV
jgi:hypothetical protein